MKIFTKKRVALLTAGLLCVGMLAGCGSAEDDDDQTIRFDEKHFPDESFCETMQYLADSDGDFILSAEEAAAVTELDIGLSSSFEDITGLEYFTSLKKLCIGNVGVTSIDLSKCPSLEWVRFIFLNHLESVKLGNNPALKEFSVLDCHNLTEIDTSGAPALEILALNGCDITALDLSNNAALTTVELQSTDLTGMVDLSANTALEVVRSEDNESVEGLILPASTASNIARYIDSGLKIETK